MIKFLCIQMLILFISCHLSFNFFEQNGIFSVKNKWVRFGILFLFMNFFGMFFECYKNLIGL